MNHPDNMTLKATVELPDSDSGNGSGKTKTTVSFSDLFSWPGRVALLIAVVFSPWAFASVESWAQSWITVALLVGLAFWWFETALNNRSSQVFPYISILVFLGIGIGLFQTVSLPDWLAESVLGRQQEIYTKFTGDPDTRASFSLDKDGTWYQIRLLLIAVAGLLLGCRYFRTKRDIVLLMSVVAINGVAISVFGIVHKLTSNGKMFWFHELLDGGGPFGPFVNKNNSAGYLLMCLGCCLGLLPIIMAKRKNQGPPNIVSKEIPIWRQLHFYVTEFVAELTATKVSIIVGLVLIASAIPTSLSRGGVVGLLAASIGTVLVYGMARKPKNSTLVLLPLIGLTLMLTLWVGFGDQLIARFEKIDTVNIVEADSRVQHWKDTWPAVSDMGLLGSGLGSYRNVHRLYRSDPENTLFHYAENQYFQSVVEAGWLGLVIFLLAWILAYRYASLALFEGSSPTTIGVGTMGVFVVFSQAIASCFDFGLYIPANMLLMSVLIGFLAYHSHGLAVRLKRRSWLRFKLSNKFVQVVVLVLFAGMTMVSLDLFRRAAVDQLMRPRFQHLNRQNMDLAKTDLRITALSVRMQRSPTVESLNYGGELRLHRARLMLYDSMVQSQDFQDSTSVMTEERKKHLTDNLWNLTEVLRMHETVFYLRREEPRELGQFIETVFSDLQKSRALFMFSRQASPLQPAVHLRLGEIQGVISKDPRAGDVDIERALTLAPSNPSFRRVAGIYYLQSGNVDGAVPHLKKYLELKPAYFTRLMKLITGRTGRSIALPDEEAIAKIIPDDGKMLYQYVVDFMPSDSPLRSEFLERAALAVSEVPFNLRENNLLMGDIRLEQGDLEDAVDAYRKALIRQPSDPKTRFKRARLLVDLGRLDEALEEAKYLESHTQANSTYNKFLIEVQAAVEKRDKEKD